MRSAFRKQDSISSLDDLNENQIKCSSDVFLEMIEDYALLFQIDRLPRDISIKTLCIRFNRKLHVEIYYKGILMPLLPFVLNRKKCRSNQFQHDVEFNYSHER